MHPPSMQFFIVSVLKKISLCGVVIKTDISDQSRISVRDIQQHIPISASIVRNIVS